MKNFVIPALALGLSGLSSAALAAEPFSGPFVGVQTGWEQSDVGTASTPLGDFNSGRSNDVATGGVFVGYDYRLTPKVVAGVEAGISLSDSDELVSTVAGRTVSIDAERSIDLSARLGYLVTDSTLVYARGGYSNVRAETALTSAGSRSDKSNLDGWLVGAGVERALSQRISTRFEYRYTDLGEGNGKFDRHQLLLGVSYRF